MSLRGLLITGAVGLAILVGVAIAGILLFGGRAQSPASEVTPVEPLPRLAPPSQEAGFAIDAPAPPARRGVRLLLR